MKFALAVIFAVLSIACTDALPLELIDWYTPNHAPLANYMESRVFPEQTLRTDIRRTEKHRELDELYSDQLFEESLFLTVPLLEV
jgi:hypothetical protein